jgi:hypothetical protein
MTQIRHTFIASSVIYSIAIFTIILPSYFSKPVLVAVVLLSVSLLISSETSFKIKGYGNFMLAYGFILSIILSFVFYHIDHNTSVTTVAGYVLYLFLLFYIISTMSDKCLERTIGMYIYLSIAMAFLGLVVWVLVHVEHSAVRKFNVSEFTNGIYSRDSKIGPNEGIDSYFTFYYLGLVLRENFETLFGISFYRNVGWSHEPNTASMFVAPAIIILTISKNYFRKVKRYTSLLVLVLFYMSCFSIGGIIVAMFFYPLYLFTKHGHLLQKVSLVTLGPIFYLFFLILMISYSSAFRSRLGEFGMDAGLTGSLRPVFNQLLWFMGDFGAWEMMSYLLISVIVVLSIVVCLFGIKQSKKHSKNYSMSYYMIVLFILLMGFKGTWQIILYYGFFIFWIVVLLRKRRGGGAQYP